MLRIHETTKESGELASVFLRVDDGVVSIVDDEGTFALPDGAIRTLMARYGAPLELNSVRLSSQAARVALFCAQSDLRELCRRSLAFVFPSLSCRMFRSYRDL